MKSYIVVVEVTSSSKHQIRSEGETKQEAVNKVLLRLDDETDPIWHEAHMKLNLKARIEEIREN